MLLGHLDKDQMFRIKHVNPVEASNAPLMSAWGLFNFCSDVNRLLCLFAGADPAGESESRAGDAEPTRCSAGEQLQGVGTLAWPVQHQITGQLRIDGSSLCLTQSLASPIQCGTFS